MAYILEACVDSLESALAAERGGATRLELCENLIIGGTTPSPAFFRQIRSEVMIPIHILVRPRFGDFLYSDKEMERMCAEIAELAQAGGEAFVIGALQSNGDLDREAIQKMMAAAKGARFTLHRAFDMCRDMSLALEEAIALGFSSILTSGGRGSACEGANQIAALERASAGRIEILVGAGVNAKTIADLKEKTGARAFHMSGKSVIESRMEYRNEHVSMGLPGFSEYEIYVTDEGEIRRAVENLKESGN